MKKIATIAAFAALGFAAFATPAMATTYKFTVLCNGGNVGVAQWETGDIDPGQEYLRVVTGTNNPGCSVRDYDPATDSWAPVTVYAGAGGVVQGIPFLGEILGNVFGF